jgi:hypothetical protein
MDIASDCAHPRHAMKHVLGLILVLGSLAALGIVRPASAEPSGFAGFAWGTPLAVIEPALKAQCGFSTTVLSVLGRQLFVCSGYHEFDNLGLGPADVRLEFVNGGLQGYTVVVRRAHEAKLRAMAPQFVRATSAASTGTHRLDSCLPGFFCLTVRTY